ncbi:hypothetical protein GpartN1_g6541.t1 [Galdieria partita]|uniref:Uncharacterized protein n=1 Tax=Galdieria partita TaxID=83374 RepID=A0A9C7Q2A8_9RHOD|nr:hypothetical protein GpartN1_g6541.t1 [Galdieria partita]
MEQQLESFCQQASSQLKDFHPLFHAATLYEHINQNLNLTEYCAKISIHLHTVEEQLYDKIWNKQQELMESIQKVKELQQRLTQLSSQLKDTKQNLSFAARQTYLNGDDIISLERRRRFLRRIQSSLVDTQSLIRTSILAEVALKKDQLSECHNLCKQFESVLLHVGKDRVDLTKLTCLRSLRDRITKVAVECVKRMHRNLRSLCRKLTRDDFWTIFIAYEEFDAAEALALRLNEEYGRALADVPAQFEMNCAEEKTKERHFHSLLFGFQLFSDILVSFHSLVEYLNNISRDSTMAQQVDNQQERVDQQQERDIHQPGQRQEHRKEFVRIVLSHLMSKVDFWELLQDRVVKWLQDMEKENISIAVSTMHMIYNAVNLFQALGEVFTSTSEDGSLSKSVSATPTEHSNVTTSSRILMKMTEQWLQKSFEHQHEENIQIFQKNLLQETWQRIMIEPIDFISFLSKFESVANASTSQEAKDLQECLLKLLKEEANPLRVLSLEVVYSSSMEHNENRQHSISIDFEETYHSYVFVSSCLILLNIVTRYLELALSIPCLRVSILLAVGHLLQLYFCHVYSVCNSVCHRTELEMERQERGRELCLEDFMHSKDRALLGQLRQVEDASLKSNNSDISKCDACVAVESWKSLANLFSHCLQLLERSNCCTPTSRQRILHSWNAVFALTHPIRSAVYDCIAAQIIEARRFIQEIANSNYSLHASNSIFQTDNIALQDQPSTAISRVLQNIKKWRDTEPLPPNACLETLWERIAATCCHTFVVGVSKVKHCTPEGRARMLVDLRHLERGLESFTGLRPVPGAQRAASHIRAYFLDEKEILSWVETEASKLSFTDAQLETLIETGPGRNLSRSAKYSLIQTVLRTYHRSKQNEQPSRVVNKDTYTQTCIASEDNHHPTEYETGTTQDDSLTDDAVPMDNIFGQDVLSEIFESDKQ